MSEFATLDRGVIPQNWSRSYKSAKDGYVLDLREITEEKTEWKIQEIPVLSYVHSYYHFNILDKKFVLRYELKVLYEEIIESKKYLDYKYDWDDEEAVACNPYIFIRAIEMLIIYSENVFKFHNIVIKAPEITLGVDGSIDLYWKCENKMLLMNVVNLEEFDVHFYGKSIKGTVIKGFLSNLEIDRDLSNWMKELL